MKYFKSSSLLFIIYLIISSLCGLNRPVAQIKNSKKISIVKPEIFINVITGAENTIEYLSLLSNKKIGVVTNQTGIIKISDATISIVDYLLNNKME